MRWKQRFYNLEKAYNLFQRRINEYRKNKNNEAYQIFEITTELAWKTLKDYLYAEGVAVNSPKQTIRQALQFNIIDNGEDWMQALEYRNLTVYPYNEENAYQILNFTDHKFEKIIKNLLSYLKQEIK